MSQFKAIIIDDEVNNRENLQGLLAKNCPSVSVIGQAKSVDEGIEIIKAFPPDVIFLDIEMPGGNGFKLLEHLDPVQFKVIFVTAFDSYALNAIKFSALDYILKPIDKAELKAAVAKLELTQIDAQDQLQNLNAFLRGDGQKIALNLADEIRLVDLKEIVRIKADNNYCEFHLTSNEMVIVSKHLGYYYEILRDQGFIRTHQSHLVNHKFLVRFVKSEGGYLVLSNGAEIPVSRSQKEHVFKFFSMH